MRGFSRRVNRLATGPSCSPRRSPRRSPPRFPTAAASARFRRSSRTRRPPRTPPHPRRTPSGRLAHPRVVLGAHHAVHLHGAATGAHEAQCGSQLVTGRVAVVGARPGVLPWVMTQVCASIPSGEESSGPHRAAVARPRPRSRGAGAEAGGVSEAGGVAEAERGAAGAAVPLSSILRDARTASELPSPTGPAEATVSGRATANTTRPASATRRTLSWSGPERRDDGALCPPE